MSEIPGNAEVVIKGVESKMVKNGTLKLWEVETAEGTKWATFKEPTARAAHALIGKPALIAYVIKSDGQRTSYYLNEIGPAAPGSELPPAAADPSAQTASPVVPQASKDISFTEFATVERDRQDAEKAKTESIHRQVATKVAAELSKTPADFWANVSELIAFYATGSMPDLVQRSGVTSHAAFDDTQPADDIPF